MSYNNICAMMQSERKRMLVLTGLQPGEATTVAWLDEHVTKVSNARTGLLYSNLMKESDKEIEIVIKVEIK